MSTRFSGLRILAVSPMKRTPATTRVLAWCWAPKRAISGGCVGDSLEMARFGAQHQPSTLVVAGGRFMGGAAKILSPEKRGLMPDHDAQRSLAPGAPKR